MKRRPTLLSEVELVPNSPPGGKPLPTGPTPGAPFVVQLPEGATVSVPAGFDFDEALALLTLVREATR